VTAAQEHKINASALQNRDATLNAIIDHKGFASPEVTALGGPEAPRKRVSEWRVGHTGDWRILSDGASGRDLIELVAHLGSCDRPTAAAFLGRLVALIEREAA
jgi:hypothetical protein